MQKTAFQRNTLWAWATLAGALSVPAHAGLIVNGGFESGLSGWTTANQLGSEGSFVLQTGTASPVSMSTVPAPPQGTTAAMTDAFGPGSHVMYQDFLVPASMPLAVVTFSLFVNNTLAPNFYTPATLDFSTPALNQRARVDIMTTSADPFSVAAGDVLQTLFETAPGSPLSFGYTNFTVDVTSLLQSRLGQTLRLRFAEVDNVGPFNLGVDQVDISDVPEPASWLLLLGGATALAVARRRRA